MAILMAIESPATTVPLDILVTSARPDIVFVHNDNTISIIELTIPFNTQESFNRAHILKTKKYEVLVSDLEHRGYSTGFLALEIGASWSLLYKNYFAFLPSLSNDHAPNQLSSPL